MALRVLYKPADELLAVRIKDLLEQEGISAMLRSYQIPWYDGIARMMRPEWGEVLVNEEDFSAAQEVLDSLLTALRPEAPIDEEDQQEWSSNDYANDEGV